MSRLHERGSALIEAVVIGSVLFLIVAAAIGSSLRLVSTAAQATGAARASAVHAARHDDVGEAQRIGESLYPNGSVEARRDGDSIVVAASSVVPLAHPLGMVSTVVRRSARMPLAPFRSDRG